MWAQMITSHWLMHSYTSETPFDILLYPVLLVRSNQQGVFAEKIQIGLRCRSCALLNFATIDINLVISRLSNLDFIFHFIMVERRFKLGLTS